MKTITRIAGISLALSLSQLMPFSSSGSADQSEDTAVSGACPKGYVAELECRPYSDPEVLKINPRMYYFNICSPSGLCRLIPNSAEKITSPARQVTRVTITHHPVIYRQVPPPKVIYKRVTYKQNPGNQPPNADSPKSITVPSFATGFYGNYFLKTVSLPDEQRNNNETSVTPVSDGETVSKVVPAVTPNGGIYDEKSAVCIPAE